MCQHTITTYSCQHQYYSVLNCSTYTAALSAYNARHRSGSLSPRPVCRRVRTDKQFRSHFCPPCEDKYLHPVALQTPRRAATATQLPGLGAGTMATRDGRAQARPKPALIPRGSENRKRERPERPLRTVQVSAPRTVAQVSDPSWSYSDHTASGANRPTNSGRLYPASGSHARHVLEQRHAAEVTFERERREKLRAQERRAAEVSAFDWSEDEEEAGWQAKLQARAKVVKQSEGKKVGSGKPKKKKNSHCVVM